MVIDYDSERNPALILGKLNQIPLNTDNKPVQLADLELAILAVVVQMRLLEKLGAKVNEMVVDVLKMIEKGMFDANFEINVNPLFKHNDKCKEK